MNANLGKCICLAEQSLAAGGFPVGAIIFNANTVISSGLSCTEATNDVTAHAEIQAIRSAGKRAFGGILYSSLEPCMMCLAASSWAGIRRVIFACSRSAVDPAYFETSSSSAEIAQLLKSRMEIIAETSREKEVVNLILRWQAQHTQFQIRTNDLPAR